MACPITQGGHKKLSHAVTVVRQQVVSLTVNDVCVTWFGINRPICSLLSPLQQQCHATDSNGYRFNQIGISLFEDCAYFSNQ